MARPDRKSNDPAHHPTYAIADILSCGYNQHVCWEVTLATEVDTWYQSLKGKDLRIVHDLIDLLAKQGHKLPFPHARPLKGGLWELRCKLQNGTVQRRITYVFDPDRKAITLTTFQHRGRSDRQEILRARRAQADHEKRKQNDWKIKSEGTS